MTKDGMGVAERISGHSPVEHVIKLMLPSTWTKYQVKEFAERWYQPEFRLNWEKDPWINKMFEDLDPITGLPIAQWFMFYTVEVANQFKGRADFVDTYMQELFSARKEWEKLKK